MSDLVTRLSQGQHPVEASLRPEKTVKALKECLDRGFVHIRFTQTRGGTELGFSVDREHSDFSGADFDNGTGRLVVAGDLSLDFVKVRCVAEIDVSSLEGQGHLEILEQRASASV
jgi:hypothetical protein